MSENRNKSLKDYFQWYNYKESYEINNAVVQYHYNLNKNYYGGNMMNVWDEYGDFYDRDMHDSYNDNSYLDETETEYYNEMDDGDSKSFWEPFYGIQMDEEIFGEYMEEDD